MFVAVGDEGGEWVHVVCMLHHWDFVGLLRKICATFLYNSVIDDF